MRTVTDYSRLRALAERCAANERAVMEPIERKLEERGFVFGTLTAPQAGELWRGQSSLDRVSAVSVPEPGLVP